MPADYKKELGLDEFLQPVDAPVTTKRDFTTGYKFSQGYEVQTKAIRASILTVENLVYISPLATGVGSVAGSTMVDITFTLSPTDQYKRQINMGVPFIAIYEGTARDLSKQIYPNYQLITSGKWYGNSGFDYAQYNGTNSVYVVNLYLNGAGTSIYIEGQWKYIANNSGVSDV